MDCLKRKSWMIIFLFPHISTVWTDLINLPQLFQTFFSSFNLFFEFGIFFRQFAISIRRKKYSKHWKISIERTSSLLSKVFRHVLWQIDLDWLRLLSSKFFSLKSFVLIFKEKSSLQFVLSVEWEFRLWLSYIRFLMLWLYHWQEDRQH